MSSAESPNFTSVSPDGDDGGGMTRGANYFFGFLITFIVLLVLFVACGVGSRRRFVARRDAAMMAQLEPWAPDQPGGVFKEPTIHETWLVVEKEKGWADIQPLNLQIMRASDLLPDDFHPDHQRDYQAASNAGAFSVTPESPPPRQSFLSRLASLPRAMFPSFHRPLSKPSAPAPDEEKADHPNDPIQGVQVSVVVKFPSAIDTRSSRHSADSLNGDYALGVRNVGWAPEFSALMTRDHSPQSI